MGEETIIAPWAEDRHEELSGRGVHAVWGGGAQGGGDRGSWLGRRGSGEMARQRSVGSIRMEDMGSDVILFDFHLVGKRSFSLIWRE
jgi:hypothetical protein